MSEKNKIVEKKLKYVGIFDFKDAYSFLYTLISDWGYGLNEKSYSEKVKGDSKEIDISWEGSRKIDDYFKFELLIDWKILGLKDAEVMKDGKKIKANSGEVEIKMTGILVKDYEDKWSGTPFMKFLRGVYDKFVIAKTTEEYEDKLTAEVEEAVDEMKAFFVLEAKKR